MACLWDRFSYTGDLVLTLSNGAVDYFVVAAVDCTLSFDSVLNSSLSRCVGCLCDSNSISGELISTFSTVNYVVVMTLRIAGWVDIILFNWAAGIMITRSFKNLLRHGECTANLTLLTGRFTVFSTCWVYCLEDFLSMAGCRYNNTSSAEFKRTNRALDYFIVAASNSTLWSNLIFLYGCAGGMRNNWSDSLCCEDISTSFAAETLSKTCACAGSSNSRKDFFLMAESRKNYCLLTAGIGTSCTLIIFFTIFCTSSRISVTFVFVKLEIVTEGRDCLAAFGISTAITVTLESFL